MWRTQQLAKSTVVPFPRCACSTTSSTSTFCRCCSTSRPADACCVSLKRVVVFPQIACDGYEMEPLTGFSTLRPHFVWYRYMKLNPSHARFLERKLEDSGCGGSTSAGCHSMTEVLTTLAPQVFCELSPGWLCLGLVGEPRRREQCHTHQIHRWPHPWWVRLWSCPHTDGPHDIS